MSRFFLWQNKKNNKRKLTHGYFFCHRFSVFHYLYVLFVRYDKENVTCEKRMKIMCGPVEFSETERFLLPLHSIHTTAATPIHSDDATCFDCLIVRVVLFLLQNNEKWCHRRKAIHAIIKWRKFRHKAFEYYSKLPPECFTLIDIISFKNIRNLHLVRIPFKIPFSWCF